MLTAVSLAGPGERALTDTARGHLIHNRQIFSPDGRHLYFDSRNDETQLARSASIGRVEIDSGKEQTIYQVGAGTPFGPGTGAVTCNPQDGRLAFLHGLPDASPALPYAPHRRCGVTLARDGSLVHLDARDVTPPFAPGASRGGTHAHHWSPDGSKLSFTYNDALLPLKPAPDDLRTVGVMIPGHPVHVAHPAGAGEFDGTAFTILLVAVKPAPEPGSDQVSRAFDEDWAGPHRIAFQGIVRARDGRPITEVFLAELPIDLPPAGREAAGQADSPPPIAPGVTIRRLTRTEDRRFPGVQGPRHWVRAAPDGSLVAFLAKDDRGVVQIFGVPPGGGVIRQLSRLEVSVDTPFDWSPDARLLACSAGGRICIVEAATGKARFLTDLRPPGQQPRHGVVFSPDGRLLAFNRLLPHPAGGSFLQVCLVQVPDK